MTIQEIRDAMVSGQIRVLVDKETNLVFIHDGVDGFATSLVDFSTLAPHLTVQGRIDILCASDPDIVTIRD